MKKKRRNLFVAVNQLVANQLQKVFGPDWLVVGTGSALCGEAFDYALISWDWTHSTLSTVAQQWLEESVKTRVMGEVIFL